MLWQELEAFWSRAQEHLAQTDPISGIGGTQKRLQVIASAEWRRSEIDLLRRPLQESNRDVSVGEGLPLEQEAARAFNALTMRINQLKPSFKVRLKPALTCESEPQCSKPKFVKSFIKSKRSLELMSQCLLSLISVKIHGLMSAPRAIITPTRTSMSINN